MAYFLISLTEAQEAAGCLVKRYKNISYYNQWQYVPNAVMKIVSFKWPLNTIGPFG